MCMHSEPEKDEEKGMPIIVMKDSRAKTIVSEDITSTGVVDFAVGGDDRAAWVREADL